MTRAVDIAMALESHMIFVFYLFNILLSHVYHVSVAELAFCNSRNVCVTLGC